MTGFYRLLTLPAAILTLLAPLAIYAQDLPWPHSHLRDQNYYSEHEHHMKREWDIEQTLQWQAPPVIKKMRSDDAGEKFYFHYFGFEDTEKKQAEASNATTYLGAPIAPHTNHDRIHFHLFGRNIGSRGFQCPSNTTSCSSIGSDLCCPTDDTCVSVSSNIGCCPSGETCTATVESCDTSAGYTSCPNSSNGGCCVPGAVCQGTGCVFVGTSTVIATVAISTVRSSASSTATSSDETTVVVPAATSVSGYTTTVTVTESGKTTTIVSATTITPSSSTSASSTSTPSASTTITTTTGSSATASAAVRPTSVSSDTSVSAATVTSTTSNTVCPTGYYMCSAYYLGGCCQVGRDCDTTSCPSTASTTVASSGATVVVPAAASASETQGSCAGGWYTCAASAGGGCCPSGYVCGTASCSATISGEQNTGKEAPSSGNVLGWTWSFFIVAVGTGVGMVIL